MHQDAHRLLCSNSCHHPTTALSGSRSKLLLAVSYSENWPQGGMFPNHGMRWPDCGRFQKKPSASASNNGRTDGASVRAHKGPTLEVIG
jgi:hypothetical protein